MDLKNVYFIIGTSYAGKSTTVKNLAKRHNGIALEENYHDAKLPELDSKEFPNLCYTRDLQDWHEFIRRTPEQYITWLKNTKKECEIIELQMLEELLAKPETRDRKIFVDTNIRIETLHKITDTRHVLVMMAPPEDGVNRFFDRPDAEKQFLYQLIDFIISHVISVDDYITNAHYSFTTLTMLSIPRSRQNRTKSPRDISVMSESVLFHPKASIQSLFAQAIASRIN
jgi:hypothetical protein